ncbi:glycine oxidase ThiO [Tengunoibacter tsumagoiensis]|uniref:glycine oxidase n=1 Tax=Tengunoibacter tsumagoiensis TaxID=2014871 RepID=A0A402A2F6_9CHLR|nr:glycine oxidase ThiO [Tengunoibacter tsumagoiensis]GCE13181.1 glycine oxidase ThiO [Tengunoibacter tsumagoiensis]
MHTPDIVIVGGGVIGCSLAYHLSRQQVKVTLLERGEIGGEASSAAAGLFSWLKPQSKIRPMAAYNQFLATSQELFPQLVADLEEQTGLKLEYEQSGTLRTIHHEVRIARLQTWLQTCQEAGLNVQLLNEAETREREPLLTTELFGAVFFPGEGQVKAARVVEALALAARQHGVEIRPQTPVVGLKKHGSQITGVVTASGEVVHCQQLILAPGAWAAECGRWLQLNLPIVPQRGQILALHQPNPPVRHIIIGKGIYIAPKQDQTVIIGATNDDVGFNTRVTAGGISSLLSSAFQLMPALEHSNWDRAWAGLRPKTSDNQPILGRAPGWENVILAVGHYSFGVLSSAITAQALTQLVLTGDTPTSLKPFGFERFVSP